IETSEGEGRYTRRSGPSSAALPHLRHVLVEHLLLVGRQHGANVIHLTAEQPPHLLPRCGVGRIPGREGRHLSAIVLLDRVDFRLLVRCQRDVLEQHPHPPPGTTAHWSRPPSPTPWPETCESRAAPNTGWRCGQSASCLPAWCSRRGLSHPLSRTAPSSGRRPARHRYRERSSRTTPDAERS